MCCGFYDLISGSDVLWVWDVGVWLVSVCVAWCVCVWSSMPGGAGRAICDLGRTVLRLWGSWGAVSPQARVRVTKQTMELGGREVGRRVGRIVAQEMP